jgi:F0F1-type ATP synthase membrane subunit c/vacuolar-type H+-ATPase subunit K
MNGVDVDMSDDPSISSFFKAWFLFVALVISVSIVGGLVIVFLLLSHFGVV